MIGIGIGLGTLGYGLVYYGAQLWKDTPQSMAYAFGFSKTNTAAATAAANSAAGHNDISPGALGHIGVSVLLGPFAGLFGHGL